MIERPEASFPGDLFADGDFLTQATRAGPRFDCPFVGEKTGQERRSLVSTLDGSCLRGFGRWD